MNDQTRRGKLIDVESKLTLHRSLTPSWGCNTCTITSNDYIVQNSSVTKNSRRKHHMVLPCKIFGTLAMFIPVTRVACDVTCPPSRSEYSENVLPNSLPDMGLHSDHTGISRVTCNTPEQKEWLLAVPESAWDKPSAKAPSPKLWLGAWCFHVVLGNQSESVQGGSRSNGQHPRGAVRKHTLHLHGHLSESEVIISCVGGERQSDWWALIQQRSYMYAQLWYTYSVPPLSATACLRTQL